MPSKQRRPTTRRYRSLDDPDTLRTIVRNVGEGIYITTADGEILDANPAFLRILGYKSLAHIRKIRAQELYSDPNERNRWQRELEKAGEIRDIEVELRRADGTAITVLDTSYVCRDEDTGDVFFHGILVDIDSRKAVERQLVEASIRDPLTGCYNRRFLGELQREVDRRPFEEIGCIYVDLDGFKQYNDTYGHAAGDEALIGVSRFLMRELRAHDSVIRVGGDEFVAVLRGATEEQIRQVVKRLEANAASAGVVPFSVGWAERQKGEACADTLERADQRLLVGREGARLTRDRRKEDRAR